MNVTYKFSGEISVLDISKFYLKYEKSVRYIKVMELVFENVSFNNINAIRLLEIVFYNFLNININMKIEFIKLKFKEQHMLYPSYFHSVINRSMFPGTVLKNEYFLEIWTYDSLDNDNYKHYRAYINKKRLELPSIDAVISTEVTNLLDANNIPRENGTAQISEIVGELVSNIVNHVDSNAIIEIVCSDVINVETSQNANAICITCLDFNSETLIQKMTRLFNDGYFAEYFPDIQDSINNNGVCREDILFAAFQRKVSTKKTRSKAGGAGLPTMLKAIYEKSNTELSRVELNCEDLDIRFNVSDLDFTDNISISPDASVNSKLVSKTNVGCLPIKINQGLLISFLFVLKEEK